MKAALETVVGLLGHEYDLIIGGERVRTKGQDPLNQSGETQPGGWYSSGGHRRACGTSSAAALKAFETWQFVSTEAARLAVAARGRTSFAIASLSSAPG